MIITDDYSENRLQEFRARILSRMRKPCAGRFDPSWDMEVEFNDDVQTAKFIANELIKSAPVDVDKYYFAAIIDEIEWAENSVESAWKRQDDAIDRSRNSPPQKDSNDPGQTTLF